MRPVTLELQGFGPFRDHTTVDFQGHDLVALTGPTGAGKSSIIDGIAFALYGSIARYDNEKLVAPVINAVGSEARVRLDFSSGTTNYTAVRIVRRTDSGASTKEARLESGDEVIASTAAEVTAAVERIVGLSFSQFTKTVILPQGEFAQFLKVKPSSRQELLRQILGLDKFAAVGKAARTRSRDLTGQIEALEQTLEDGSGDAVGDPKKLRTELETIEAQLATLESAEGEWRAASEQHDEAAARVEELDHQLLQLDQLAVPDETKSFAASIATATTALASAQKKVDAAKEKHDAAVAAREELPPSYEIAEIVEQHQQLGELAEEVDDLTDIHAASADRLESVSAKAEDAQVALATAEEELDHARVVSGARGIAETLHVGDECPVCTQMVAELPKAGSKKAQDSMLKKAESARAEAQAGAHVVVKDVQSAVAIEASASGRLDAAVASHDSLRELLAGQPTAKQALALQKRIATAEDKVDVAHKRLVAATEMRDDAQEQVDESSSGETTLRRQFTTVRDSVANLAPPTPSETSIHDDWTELAKWGAAQVKDLSSQRRDAAKQVTAATKQQSAAEKVLVKISSPYVQADTEVDPHIAGAAIRNAHADARVLLANTEDRIAREQETRNQVAAKNTERLLASEVGKHLVAGMFERWVMTDVMHDLAERATARLQELSGGAYSLTTDGKEFQIRDHRNADELRSARTLSGGETFLTSLSLALALADSITDIASTSTPPLESMFLDEGFGTLDPEALDIVATAIEDLGSSGRLVGIVTHIPSLAERVPMQIEVAPTPTGSVVTVRS